MWGELKIGQSYSREELMSRVEEMLKFVEEAHAQSQAAHVVEEGIFRRVLEMGRLTLGLFFKLFGDGDEGEFLVLPNGKKVRRLKALHTREYLSVFGLFELARAVYGTREKQKIQWIPLDAQLSLPASKFSYLLQDWDQDLAVDAPFDRVNEVIGRILGFGQSVNSLERINRQMSEAVKAYWDQETPPAAEDEGALMVIQADGKGVVMRPEAEATSQDEPVRPPAAPHPEGKEGKEGKGGKKKMALVGAAYTVDPFIRTPEEILEALFRDATNKEQHPPSRPKPLFKHVRASLLRDARDTMRPSYDEIFSWLAAEIQRRNPEGKKSMPCIMDGQDSLWVAAVEYFPGVDLIPILDIIHACSYVWAATHLFYTKGSSEAVGFAKERILRLLKGEVDGVIRGLRWKGTYEKLAGKALEELEKVCGYFENNRHRMAYDEYLAAGYPIASGVIEGACRNVIIDRMEHSGMRWVLDGAHAMLGLRCIELSGAWEEFTRFRIQRECERLYPGYAANDDYAYNVA
jgi:hypothetical protein